MVALVSHQRQARRPCVIDDRSVVARTDRDHAACFNAVWLILTYVRLGDVKGSIEFKGRKQKGSTRYGRPVKKASNPVRLC